MILALSKENSQEKQTEILFNFFDISKSGFIEKEEFIKMLYNYPKEHIFDFLEKIRAASNKIFYLILKEEMKKYQKFRIYRI